MMKYNGIFTVNCVLTKSVLYKSYFGKVLWNIVSRNDKVLINKELE